MRKFFLVTFLALFLSGCQNDEPASTAVESSAPVAESAQPADASDSPELAASVEDCSLSVGWDPWEPYHFKPSGSKVRGLDVDLRSEEHTSELQSRGHLVCRLLLEKKKHSEKA